jgi:DNA-directed RNA polymerase II subunit RPB1
MAEKGKAAKIIGIQFSILSPEEIRKNSVAEITSRDTYINNKPVIGGLFDPRMGVLEPGLLCPTDGLDYIKTPGYFGHIELARPVFYIQYLNHVMKILRCVCLKCSKLLISKEKYNYLLTNPSEKRWNKVFALASKIKRCGECNEDGCGCKQPDKLKKEGLATLFAEWSNVENVVSDTSKLTKMITPEMVIKIFKKITDDDVHFMGFNPNWSRPEWMVCQVLAVPPPSVRPSVKHDAQQRSEDDISHILVNIIKTNKTLTDKINQNAAANIINDWTTVLQYFIATMIDNKIPGVAAFAQRSGRALKSLKERLNGKTGRVRGNLMGKRVDFSARSVITPDPNISIRQLGVPKKIAMNITKPIKVNQRNKAYLLALVKKGPNEYPGAKILQKKNGEQISLKYADRNAVKLEIGDTVHRHMIDGDAVLFNRQPTLHRMSMMCHIVKVMEKGDTFRLNVGCTKPYNADFDGDEMNLHMPQDEQAEIELRKLAAVTYQLISPASNSSIVGVYQDSLLGAYLFTNAKITYTKREAMNLLIGVNVVDSNIFEKDVITNFDILSQIIPPISLYKKSKRFKSDEDPKTSNHIIEIKDGHYMRGQLDKGALGGSSTGLIQRINNDIGHSQSSDFIDYLQHIVNQYMKLHSYSVGISDLIADDTTKSKITEVIHDKKNDVKKLIDQTHLGIFENTTGQTNQYEFESQVNNILNEANSKAGKIGKESLDANNRFVIMVNAGSKGSDINISQMISCLGQQNVDGKRIPYGFSNRTLPHFTKFDDSPAARGFVENSFIKGLEPTELFFHAQGGREGLIDTAVKTSTTGYIQRRLVKAMEDLMVGYDGTVRNNKGRVIQYKYGEDGIDTTKVEDQKILLCKMSIDDIYAHYSIPYDVTTNEIFTTIYNKGTLKRFKAEHVTLQEKTKQYIAFMLQHRESIMKQVFHYQNETSIHMPVAFEHIIRNIKNQCKLTTQTMSDITPLEIYTQLEYYYSILDNNEYFKPTLLFKLLYYYHLSPRELLIQHFTKSAITLLLETIVLTYKKAIVNPGEMCGIIAAQSIGEPTTQLTLNTFHFAGVASKSNVTRGVPRIEEILSLSDNVKKPTMTIYLKSYEEQNQERAKTIMTQLEHTKLADITNSVQIYFDPDDLNTLIQDDDVMLRQYYEYQNMVKECLNLTMNENSENECKWIIRIELDKETMLDKNITMDDVNFAIKHYHQEDIKCVYSDYNHDNLVLRIRPNILNKKKIKSESLDQMDDIYLIKAFQDQLLQNIILRGTKQIHKVILRKLVNNIRVENNEFINDYAWVLDTVGSNLMSVLALDFIDTKRTISNDIQEVKRVLGIEAARQCIYNELEEVFDNGYINSHHLGLLCDRMTISNKMVSIFRHGINNDDIGPLAKASFEETPEMFLKAARHGELDQMCGVSANVMCGQQGYYGTSCFQVLLDISKYKATASAQMNFDTDDILTQLQEKQSTTDCSTETLTIENTISHIKTNDLGNDDDYNLDL